MAEFIAGADLAQCLYEDVVRAKPVLDRHQTVMWEIRDLMTEWEALQASAPHSTPVP